MTPVLPERARKGDTLKQDHELEGFLDNNMIFTDISMNKENKVSWLLERCDFIAHHEFPPPSVSCFSLPPFSSPSLSPYPQNRSVVVREPSGVLRDATWEERDRMMQVYFPSLGRKMWLSHMLTDEGLIPVLEAGRYRDILEMACLQCEPDSADYIRVSSSTIIMQRALV